MSFSIAIILVLFVSSAMAAFVQRVTGFGFGIFIMTILPYVMPSYAESITLSGILSLTQSGILLVQLWRFISWKRVMPMLTVFLIVSYAATKTVAEFDGFFFLHVLGAVLILFSIYFFLFADKIRIKGSYPLQIGLGTLSGLMGGFFNMQGPPAVIYFVQSEPDKKSYIAQTQVYFFIGNLFMAFVRYTEGFVTPEVGYSWCCAIVGVLVGTIIGTKVFHLLPAARLKKVIYGYMAVSGVVALLK